MASRVRGVWGNRLDKGTMRVADEVDEDYESLEAEGMREYLVEIDAVGERESDAINQNLENKKEEDMTDD